MNSFLIKLGINKALRAPALRDSPETESSAGFRVWPGWSPGRQWAAPGVGCDQGGHPGPLSSSPPGSQFLSDARTAHTWTATSRDNLCMDRKYGLAPSLPVSPCHRHSVNTVLDSEKQNLFLRRVDTDRRLSVCPLHDNNVNINHQFYLSELK